MNFDITVIERFWQLLLSGVPVILGLSLACLLYTSNMDDIIKKAKAELA